MFFSYVFSLIILGAAMLGLKYMIDIAIKVEGEEALGYAAVGIIWAAGCFGLIFKVLP